MTSTLALAVVLGGAALSGLVLLGGRPTAPSLSEGRIPRVAYEAYLAAAAAAPSVAPGCAVEWAVIAGIAQVESDHGRTDGEYRITELGDVVPPMRGAALDGTGATVRVPDTDDGVLDGDTTWDRAIGPLQFIPERWRELGRDGNGDGIANPDNMFDAALTAVAHLCIRSPGDYAEARDLRDALLTYNASQAYAREVLGWIGLYRTEPLADVLESAPADVPG